MLRVLITVFAVWLTTVVAVAGAEDGAEKTVAPFLRTYCAQCHGEQDAKEGLVLAPLKETTLRDPALLEMLAERLRSQTMPPAEAKRQPPKAETNAVLDWIDGRIDAIVGTEKDPGRVTIRRLTRIDYRNTIRDLLGVQYDTGDFPSDDIAYGFDNLADVISLPPLLMERYGEAAEEISRRWLQHVAPPDKAAAERELVAVLDRAYRRPPTKEEQADLLAFFQQSQQFGMEEATRLALQKILLSPHFLFRIERDGPIGRDRELDDFELAARISYFLWSSLPDDELWQCAAEAKLRDPHILRSQIRRMLADEKIRNGLVENFAGQ